MSTKLKIIFSIIIFLFILSLSFFTIFFLNIDLTFIKFLNNHLELRYLNELEEIEERLDKFLLKQESRQQAFLDSFDMSKFMNKKRSRQVNLKNELEAAESFIFSNDSLEKIKIINNNNISVSRFI